MPDIDSKLSELTREKISQFSRSPLNTWDVKIIQRFILSTLQYGLCLTMSNIQRRINSIKPLGQGVTRPEIKIITAVLLMDGFVEQYKSNGLIYYRRK